jgi:glucose/arabinose dehydrogenase
MNALQLGRSCSIAAMTCIAALAGAPVGISLAAAPATAVTPTLPPAPGLSAPLGAGPFTYRTGEGQNIKVTVLARLTSPYAMVFLPNGDMLITQRTGEMKRIPKGTAELKEVPGGPKALPPPLPAGVHGYMAIALHPQFAQNGYIYLAYTKPPQGDSKTRTVAIARARYADGRLHDTKDVFVGEGLGGPTTVAMSADAKLWIGTTEGGKAQDTMWLGGKVLRLNDDGTIPADNPFVGRQGYRPEIYTLGHRTALGLYVHPVTGELWEAEMGPNGGDEINLLKAGRNYGWPLVSLGRAYAGPWQANVNEPMHTGYELPVVYWTPSISVTGICFYLGDAFPKWKGNLFVGGVRYGEIPGTGRVDRVVFNDKLEEVRRESLLTDLHQRIRDVKQGPDGLLYVATDEEQGAILRIEPAP